MYRIIEPEDRQPGWRDRTSLHLYDIATGIMRPLTFGSHNTYLLDIADDGSKILVSTSRSRLEKRPTTVFTVATVDLATLKADTIVADDGFVGSARFSPDGTKILVSGSPEAFNGIGKNVPEGKIPSMTDTQLFICDLAGVTPKQSHAISTPAYHHTTGAGPTAIYISQPKTVTVWLCSPTIQPMANS